MPSHRRAGARPQPLSLVGAPVGARRRSAPLATVVARLRCPCCAAALSLSRGSLVCTRGHRYDVACHGHVTLPARGRAPAGDDAAMVAARAAFLAGGHYDPLAEAIAQLARATLGSRACRPGCVVDVGAGTGHHLARLLEDLPGWSGIALDASRQAAREAMRAHPCVAAVVCDAWLPLPLRDAAAELVLSAFAPRGDGVELRRILAPDGALLVAAPTPRHLAELVAPLGLLRIPAGKRERVRARLAPWLAAADSRLVEAELVLDRADARALVRMGPSAHHVIPATLEHRLAALPERLLATLSVRVEAYRAA